MIEIGSHSPSLGVRPHCCSQIMVRGAVRNNDAFFSSGKTANEPSRGNIKPKVKVKSKVNPGSRPVRNP